MLKKIDGIVLKSLDYGESHQIIRVFSQQGGKISLMARGSKKPRSRLRAVTEPLTEATFLFFQGSGMGTLSQADVINPHASLRSDLLATAYSAYWLDLLDQLSEEKEPQPLLYRRLSQLLTLLEEQRDPEILTRIWELNLLTIAGYKPIVEHCTNCHRTGLPMRFSLALGGYLCADCLSHDPQALRMSPAVAKILPQLVALNLSRLGQIDVKPETNRGLEQILQAFMEYYLPVSFKTKSFLQQMRHLYPD